MTEQFILGNIRDLESPESVKRFAKKYAEQFRIEKRFNTCDNPIEVKVKSISRIGDSINLEFFTQEDADLILSGQASVRLLIPGVQTEDGVFLDILSK